MRKPFLSKHTIASALAVLAVVCAVVLTLTFLQQVTGSKSLAASAPQKGLSRDAALNDLHAHLKARNPFSAEEKDILFRFINGEKISDVEADIVISRVLYHRYVEGKDLNAEQKALLKQYKAFIAQSGKGIADLAENDAEPEASRDVVPSGGTPNVCGSFNYSITQSTGGVIVPGTTDTGNHCDDCTTLITLPFPFTLYDQTFTQARVSSNGNLQFVGANSDFSNRCLPTNSFSYTIFAFWDDLFTFDAASGQGIFTSVSGVAPNRIFNIEWRTQFCCDNGPPIFDFEIRLFENSTRFDIVYGQVGGSTASATVGVQRTATSGSACFTQFACSQAGSVFPGLVLSFGVNQFDICVQDESAGTLLRFNSTTGAYEFRDCRKSITLTGVGVVTKSVNNDFCKVTLSDRGPDPKRPDRNVQALVNTCTKRGDATVTTPSGQTTTIGDSNITDNSCACP